MPLIITTPLKTFGFELSSTTFVASFDVSLQTTNPQDAVFKPDGTKLYVAGGTNDSVHEYDVPTPWTLGSSPGPSFVQTVNIGTSRNARGVTFKPDGTKMYVVVSLSGDHVREFDLSPAWDISTASFLQFFNVGGQLGGPTGVRFKPDGTEMYVTGTAVTGVYQYTLLTPWNISTASLTNSLTTVVSDEVATPSGIAFNNTGTKMFVTGTSAIGIHEYNLLTPWDISSASFTQTYTNTNVQDATPTDISFNTDGLRMYITGDQNNRIFEYSL